MSLKTVEEVRSLAQEKKVVFTNGVFDLLHAGHVSYLESARELGDFLVVGLNTDESVRRLNKGPERPLNKLEDRARIVGALRCVDAVVEFGEDTPERLISELKPNIHVKGGDYKVEDLPEAKIVESYGGRVVILPLLEGRSTTNLVKKMNQSED